MTPAMTFDTLGRLRRPEYTGENRCVPCTVVNALISGVVGVALAVATRPAVGALAFAAGCLVIYLRGYLVPGTPTFTRRYFPPWLLRAFGKEPVGDRRLPASQADPLDDVDDPLVGAGVVTDDPDPELTPAFREAWHDRMDAADGVTAEDVARAFGGESADRLGPTSFVLNGSASLRWGAEAAVLADVTAADLLADRLADWQSYDRDARRSLLMGLRLCLASCPSCGGTVRAEETRVDPCCEKPHLVAEAVCADCGAVLGDTAVVDDDEVTSVRASLLDV